MSFDNLKVQRECSDNHLMDAQLVQLIHLYIYDAMECR
jgi:hypothetical protein